MSADGFTDLVRAATDYAVFTTDREGAIQEWNVGAELIHGYSAEEIRGRSCNILFVEEDREAGIPELERALALRSGSAENERWHLRKDGVRFWGSPPLAMVSKLGIPVGSLRIWSASIGRLMALAVSG